MRSINFDCLWKLKEKKQKTEQNTIITKTNRICSTFINTIMAKWNSIIMRMLILESILNEYIAHTHTPIAIYFNILFAKVKQSFWL